MIKLGIILLAYENAEGLYDKLMPFQRENIVISAVHAVFPEFHEDGFPILSKDGTHKKLEEFKKNGLIKYLCVFPVPSPEWEARNTALQLLKNDKCTHVMILDGDESYSDKDVSGLLKVIENNQDIAWFKINFKNLVFDFNHYIDDFIPPRIFKTTFYNGTTLQLDKFYWDNDVQFLDKDNNKVDYKQLPSQKISKIHCFPLHDSWRSIPRSRAKINYQLKRFKNCSYKWNEEKDCLEFNKDYYKSIGAALPEVYEV